MSKMGRLASLLPEHVDLCSLCGCAPILPEAVVLTTPKWVYREWGECRCEPEDTNDTPSTSRTPEQIATQWENLGKDNADPMESPSEGFAMDYRHEIHDYLVEKGEREE